MSTSLRSMVLFRGMLLAIVALTIGGCITFKTTPTVVKGVFKSTNRGDQWSERNLFLSAKGAGSVNNLDVLSFVTDPQDNRAFYALTAANGILYSYDAGDSWQKAAGIPDVRIESLAVDPKNKCIIYATVANTVVKTSDCARTWSEVYIDTRADKAITSLAVDPFRSAVIYAGTSSGDVLRSIDSGREWQVIERTQNRVMQIIVDPSDSQVVYVATQRNGIFKTTDSGLTWESLNEQLKEYQGALEYRTLLLNRAEPDSLILVSKYGFLKTTDGGSSWEAIKLITAPNAVDILTAAINPRNANELFYTTATTFYKTNDGGEHWITKRLPTGGRPAYLLVAPGTDAVLYLGVITPPTK